MIKLSVPDLIDLFQTASLGKVVGGLIHNINGPLQNIGLDLEMTRYMLKKGIDVDDEKNSDLLKRLNRIEEELDRLNDIIKTASNKVVGNQNEGLLNVNDYLKQEFMFLNSNLYFKHNVKTQFSFSGEPPLISAFPEHSTVAIGCLLQKIIEDIESEKISGLKVTTSFKDKKVAVIELSVENENLPRNNWEKINTKTFDSNKNTTDEIGVDMHLALKIFQDSDIELKPELKSKGTKIKISVPLNYR